MHPIYQQVKTKNATIQLKIRINCPQTHKEQKIRLKNIAHFTFSQLILFIHYHTNQHTLDGKNPCNIFCFRGNLCHVCNHVHLGFHLPKDIRLLFQVLGTLSRYKRHSTSLLSCFLVLLIDDKNNLSLKTVLQFIKTNFWKLNKSTAALTRFFRRQSSLCKIQEKIFYDKNIKNIHFISN